MRAQDDARRSLREQGEPGRGSTIDAVGLELWHVARGRLQDILVSRSGSCFPSSRSEADGSADSPAGILDRNAVTFASLVQRTLAKDAEERKLEYTWTEAKLRRFD